MTADVALSAFNTLHTAISCNKWVTFCVLKELDQLQGSPTAGQDGWHTGNTLKYAHENPHKHFLRYKQCWASTESALHGSSFLPDLLITTSYGILGRDLQRNHTSILFPSRKHFHLTLSNALNYVFKSSQC